MAALSRDHKETGQNVGYSPANTAVPIGAEGAARSALKATSEVGTGGPATRIIEADVLPTSPGHGAASGALGGLYTHAFV